MVDYSEDVETPVDPELQLQHNREHLGQRLRRYRMGAQISWVQIATACGVTPDAILLWECGQAVPTTEQVGKYCNEIATTIYAELYADTKDVWRAH